MRHACELAVWVDIRRCMDGGLVFWTSKNNVIMSRDDHRGIIESKYIWQVKDLVTGKVLAGPARQVEDRSCG